MILKTKNQIVSQFDFDLYAKNNREELIRKQTKRKETSDLCWKVMTLIIFLTELAEAIPLWMFAAAHSRKDWQISYLPRKEGIGPMIRCSENEITGLAK